MKIFKWITVLFVAISTFSSCSPTKSFTNNQNSILLDYQKSLKTEITNLTNNNLVSTRDCKIWEKDRNDFILMVKEYKDKNEIVRKKSNKAGTAFVITGTVVGVGGGIYGLFSDGDTKGASIN
ncbi:hypothetical protein [Flavobacterium ginsengisoli]|uniref:hypothetical protein n=1 Tax=Flavobacterium ginsengisoli TaxID=871694 RepID=UPI0024151AD7|nr:hypothetical protein [Flavobacterium ginsengisoli]